MLIPAQVRSVAELLFAGLASAAACACTVIGEGTLSDKPLEADLSASTGAAGVLKQDGAACAEDGQCSSGSCADGVCCQTACSAGCAACNLVGSEGACTPIAAGTDPDADCDPMQRCDGAGACKNNEGVGCAMDAECATGHCADDVCCDQPCDGSCEACSASKSGAPDGTCSAVAVATDPDSECRNQAGCLSAGLCCGQGAPTVDAACPLVCNDGCDGGTCSIVCDGDSCQDEIKCPAGFDCRIKCDANDSCKDSFIVCPPSQECAVICPSGGKRCDHALVQCADGPCVISCLGGDACKGAVIECGENQCSSIVLGGDAPALNCNDSCDCAGSMR